MSLELGSEASGACDAHPGRAHAHMRTAAATSEASFVFAITDTSNESLNDQEILLQQRW